jgi:hypothetical protein
VTLTSAGTALEDLHVELFLELLDRHAERGLRHEAGFGRAAEVALARHGDDVLQLGQGHAPIVPSRRWPYWRCHARGAMTAILQGLRVLELGQVLAGPFAGAILADLGAEVVKLERVDGGDDARHMGPPFRHGDALNFQVFNRGKQSVALDLKTDAGRAAFERLAADRRRLHPQPAPRRAAGAGHRRPRAVRAPPAAGVLRHLGLRPPAARWRCGPATSR